MTKLDTDLKVLPGGFGLARLPATVFHPLVGDDQVVPLAADALHRQGVTLGLELLLDALEELRALTCPVQTPAAAHRLDQEHDALVGELSCGHLVC